MANKKKGTPKRSEIGTEKDLEQVRGSTKRTYETHREKDEDDFPQDRRQEYLAQSSLRQKSVGSGRERAFADLVEEQKLKLPAVAASNAKLAQEVQATTDALAMLDLVSRSLNVLAEVIGSSHPGGDYGVSGAGYRAG